MRRVVTRVINVFPTTLCTLIGIDPLLLLVYSQVLLSLLIPLAMIPLLWYTSRATIMGPFVNRRITTIASLVLGMMIIVLNAALLYSAVAGSL